MYLCQREINGKTRTICVKPHKTIKAAELCAKGRKAPFHPTVTASVLDAESQKLVARWVSQPIEGKHSLRGQWAQTVPSQSPSMEAQ